MKKFQSTAEGIWTENVIVPLNQEQISLLNSTEEADFEPKAALINTIQNQRKIEVEYEKSTILTYFYQTKKPPLKVNDIYELISIDVSEPVENAFSGILNCRVNNEHIQVRF